MTRNENWQDVVYCDGRRWDTAKLTQLIDEQQEQRHYNGITLLGVWKTQSGRILVVTDSVWASGRNDGTCVGVQAYFANEDGITALAKRYGGPISELVPEGE